MSTTTVRDGRIVQPSAAPVRPAAPTPRYRSKSVMGRLQRFFEDNPDEELTQEQFCTKFDVPPGSAATRIAEALRDGLVERVIVYRRPAQRDEA